MKATALGNAEHAAQPHLRPHLADVATYKPGRPAGDGSPARKLSANENPYPPLPSVLDVISAAATTINRYPDPASDALVHRLAESHGLAPEQVVIGAGSVALCQQLVNATTAPGDEVLYAWPSFEAYPLITRLADARSAEVELDRHARHDLSAMAAHITDRTRLIFVCNPNNPTGTTVTRTALEDFLARVPTHVIVAIDEAYREFVRDSDSADGLELLRTRPNVCVLRTFSKAYGLAGLRIGYAFAHREIADALRKTAMPFSVSSIAQAAALASLDAEPELLDRVDALIGERQRLAHRLERCGISIPRSEANFLWLPLGEDTAGFAAHCHNAGLSVRPFAGAGVRVSVAPPEINALFLNVARTYLRNA